MRITQATREGNEVVLAVEMRVALAALAGTPKQRRNALRKAVRNAAKELKDEQ